MSPWDLANWTDGQTLEFKWIVPGVRFKKSTKITKKGNRLWLRFGFSRPIMNEIKASFAGYKWHGFEEPPVKQWSVLDCPHNWFQILFLAGQNPYSYYDKSLIPYEAFDKKQTSFGELSRYRITLENGQTHETRPLMAHQAETVSHILTRHYCILAEEMGSGKTLAAIEAMEASGLRKWLWVGPRSALASVELEFRKWDSFIIPKFCTYSSLQKHNETWDDGEEVYEGIIFDESSRVKNSVAKRSIASQYLADAVRIEHGDKGFVVEMSGTPAPKSPLDWYSQCEIAMPGFLKEGNVNKLKDRLAVIHQRESAAGGAYPHLVTWLDDAKKCTICGEYEDHEFHDPVYIMEHDVEGSPYHAYKPSGINEVSNLYERMKGLVIVKFKKDCLDLPEKQYRRIQCEPRKKTMTAAKLIGRTAGSTIKALTMLRQLSDGFQYSEEEIGRETCGVCQGKQTINQPNYIGPERTVKYLRELEALPSWYDSESMSDERVLGDVILDPVAHPDLYEWAEVACPNCNGSGQQVVYQRSTGRVRCPKIVVLEDLLDEHDDVGRIVAYGGFTGSVDICCETIHDAGWEYIRVDGRGWYCSIPNLTKLEMLEAFQSKKKDHPKLAFVGQPGAAGMGLTLTASPSIVYYSNDFNAESRLQSEDRIHRPGMDVNRGATIIDLIHLPSDEYVLDNLMSKRDLQNMSMGDLKSVFSEFPDE